MSIDIIHTAAEGTLVHGTSKGDGTNTILKAAGFRWFPSLAVWGIAGSRDRQPNTYKIQQAADSLRNAGHQVTVTIDNTHRPAEIAEADRAERQEHRAQALAAAADRKNNAAEAAWEADRRAHEALPPGGEPIKIGHHSERRHRRGIERANNATRAAIAATNEAETATARANAAARTTEQRHNPVTVKNRIDKLEAEQRSDQRIIDGYRRVVARTENHEYVDEFPPATGDYRERVLSRIAQRADDINYWTGIYAAQQASGLANTYSKDTIAKGDAIKYIGSWYQVVRVNAKSVSIRTIAGATWTQTVPYHKIAGHNSARPSTESG